MRKLYFIFMCFLCTVTAFGVGDGNVHIYFLDIGQGDATLLIGPDGTSCIIDGGPSNDTTPYQAAMTDAISRGLTDNTLDYVMVTHLHTDHLMALDEFYTLYPGGLIWAYDRGGSYSSTAYTQYDTFFGASGLNKRRVAETFSLGVVTMTYLGRGGSNSTSDENNNGVIYRLDFMDFQCWFGGDLGYEYEAPKGLAAGNVDVYQVNHHGSKTSSQDAFLAYILPEAHVFSYGLDNTYGHPTEEAIDRLNAIGSYRFDTPLDHYQTKPFVYCVTDGVTYFDVNGVTFPLYGSPTPTPTPTTTSTPTPTSTTTSTPTPTPTPSATPPSIVYYAESDAVVSTTSSSFQDKTVLTFTPVAGDYLIFATAEINGSSTSYNAKANLNIDGAEYALYDAEPADSTNYQSFVTHKVVSLAAVSHTIKIQYCSESSAGPVRIRNARIAAFPLGGYYKDDNQDSQVSVTTSESAVASLAFDAAAGNYLLVATAEPCPNSTSYSIYTRFKVDGAIYDEDLLESQDTTNYYSFGAMRVVSLSAGSHTLAITAQSESGTMYIRRPRLLAVPLASIEYFYAENEAQASTTSTSFQNKTSLDFTPSSQADCLIFATARYKGNSTSYSPEVNMTVDSTSYGDCPLEPQDTSDYATFASLKALNLTSANHNIMVNYKTESSKATSYIKNSRIVAIKF
jgi:beta-lactamase superfamily II metal-dependent hydrolase